MSAFICGPDLFKQLAVFAASRSDYGLNVDPRYLRHTKARPLIAKMHHELASAYADILYQENIRSVRTRYPSDKWDELPGPIVKPLRLVVSLQDMAARPLAPVALLKLCNCLEYQSCETEDWRETLAREIVDNIRAAAIRQLPGYEDAPWDYYEEEQAA